MRGHFFRLLLGLGLMWVSTKALGSPLWVIPAESLRNAADLVLGLTVVVMVTGLFLMAAAGSRILNEGWTWV